MLIKNPAIVKKRVSRMGLAEIFRPLISRHPELKKASEKIFRALRE